MDPLWTLYGPPVDPLWRPMDPYGPPMDPLWTPCGPLWNPYGPSVDPLWTPCGPPVDPSGDTPFRTPFRTPFGPLPDPPWTPYVDPLWTPQVAYLRSPCAPPGPVCAEGHLGNPSRWPSVPHARHTFPPQHADCARTHPVYSQGGPINRKKRKYILTADQSISLKCVEPYNPGRC
eukprot:1195224-Prorocentrum_minimum.AAC.2